jgi:uncharacterized membrane protein YesL
MAALRVFGRAVSDLWYQLIGYAICNMVVFVGLLLIVPGPPLLLGLLRISTESARYNERPEVAELLRAARRHFLPAWGLAAIHLAGLLVVVVSLLFYTNVEAFWAFPLTLLTVSIGWSWLGIILYSGALLVRSERGVLVAIRNGLVLFTHYPVFSTVLMLLALAVLLLSIVVPPLLALVTLSFLVVLATRATTWALRKEGILPPETAAQEQPMELG